MARGITRLTLSVGVVPHGSLGIVAKDSHEVIGIVPVAGVARLHDIADGLAIHPGFLVASAIGGVLDLAESLERILFNGKGIGVVLVEKGLVPLGLCLAAEYLDELGDISPAGDLGDAKCVWIFASLTFDLHRAEWAEFAGSFQCLGAGTLMVRSFGLSDLVALQ